MVGQQHQHTSNWYLTAIDKGHDPKTQPIFLAQLILSSHTYTRSMLHFATLATLFVVTSARFPGCQNYTVVPGDTCDKVASVGRSLGAHIVETSERPTSHTLRGLARICSKKQQSRICYIGSKPFSCILLIRCSRLIISMSFKMVNPAKRFSSSG